MKPNVQSSAGRNSFQLFCQFDYPYPLGEIYQNPFELDFGPQVEFFCQVKDQMLSIQLTNCSSYIEQLLACFEGALEIQDGINKLIGDWPLRMVQTFGNMHVAFATASHDWNLVCSFLSTQNINDPTMVEKSNLLSMLCLIHLYKLANTEFDKTVGIAPQLKQAIDKYAMKLQQAHHRVLAGLLTEIQGQPQNRSPIPAFPVANLFNQPSFALPVHHPFTQSDPPAQQDSKNPFNDETTQETGNPFLTEPVPNFNPFVDNDLMPTGNTTTPQFVPQYQNPMIQTKPFSPTEAQRPQFELRSPLGGGSMPFAPDFAPKQAPAMEFSFAPANNVLNTPPHQYATSEHPFHGSEPAVPNFYDSDDQVLQPWNLQPVSEQRVLPALVQQAQPQHHVNQFLEPETQPTFDLDSPWGELWSNEQLTVVWNEFKQKVPSLNAQDNEHFRTPLLSGFLKKIAHLPVDLFKLQKLLDDYDSYAYIAQREQPQAEIPSLGNSDQIMEIFSKLVRENIDFNRGKDYKLLDLEWVLNYLHQREVPDVALATLVSDVLLHGFPDILKKLNVSKSEPVIRAIFGELGFACSTQGNGLSEIDLYKLALIFRYVEACSITQFSSLIKGQPFWTETKTRLELWTELVRILLEEKPNYFFELHKNFQSLLDYFSQLPLATQPQVKTVNKFFSDFLERCPKELKFDYFAMFVGSKIMTNQDGTQTTEIKTFEKFLQGMELKQESFDQIFCSAYNNRLPLAYWKKLVKYMLEMYFDSGNEGTLSNELFRQGKNSRFYRAWQIIKGLDMSFKDKVILAWEDDLCRNAANSLVNLEIKYEDFEDYLQRNRPREITAIITEVLAYYLDIKGDRQLWFETQFQIWEQMHTRRQSYQALSQKLNSLGKQVRFPPEYEEKSAFLQWSRLVATFQDKHINICRLVELPPIPIIKDELMKNCRPDVGIEENEKRIKEATIALSTKFTRLLQYVEQKQYQEYQNLLRLGPELLETTLQVLLNDSADMSENSKTICMMLSVFASMQLSVETEKQQFESLINCLNSKFGFEPPPTNPWDEVIRLITEDKLKLTKLQLDQLSDDTICYLQTRVLKSDLLQIISACAEIFYNVEDDSPDFWENLQRNYLNNDFSSNNIPNQLDKILKLGMDAFRTQQIQIPDLLKFLDSILKQDSLLKDLSVLVDQKDAILELINKPFARDAYDVMKLFDGNTQILLSYNEELRTYDGMLANRPSRTTSVFFNDKGYLAVKLGDTQDHKIKTFESLDALCSRLRKTLEFDSHGTNAPRFKVTVSLCELIQKILENLNKIDSYGYLLTAALLRLRLAPSVKAKKTFIVEVPTPSEQDSFEESLSELLNLQQKLDYLLIQIEEEIIQISKTDARWVLSLRAAQRELLTEYLIASFEEKAAFEKLDGELVSILQFAAGSFNDAEQCLSQFKRMLNSQNLTECELTEDQGPFKLLSKFKAFSQTSGRRAPEQTTELKIRYGEYENNKYLSLICYTARRCKTVPAFEPCQFLFANQLTTTAQITSFLTFAMSEKYMFYIMDLDLLQPKVRGEMIHKITELQSSLPKNGNIMMFFSKPDHLRVKQELQRYSDIFACVEPSEMKYTDKLKTQETWISRFMQALACQVVCSRAAGLGKSHYIRTRCKRESRVMFDLQLSGEISDFTLAKRFSMVHEGVSMTTANQLNKPVLAIKIDMMEKLTDNIWMIDQLLFQMVVLRCVSFKKGFLNLSNLGFLYLEIGNNYKPMLMDLPFIRWMSQQDGKVHNIERIRVDTWNFDAQVQAKALVVANVFEMIKNKLFQKQSLFQTGPWSEHIQAIDTLTERLDPAFAVKLNPYNLSDAAVHDHLLKGFLQRLPGFDESEQPSEANANMAQIVAFIQILFHQFSQLDGNWNLSLKGAGSALAEEREQNQYRVLLEVRQNLSTIIPLLSSKFIWSKTNTLRQEASTTKQLSSELANVNNKISLILKKFRQTLQKVKSWEESDKFAVIFSDGAMKLFYKQVDDVPESLKQLVSFFNQRLVQHKDLSQADQQIHFLRQLMESFDKLWTSDFCQNFLQMPEAVVKLTEDKPKLVHYLNHIKKFQNGRGFSFNPDNMLKMLLIRQKIQALQPVVIIGSTGCGKTYLISFLVKQILLDVLRITTLHSGVTEDDLVKFMCAAIQEAKRQQAQKSNKNVWVFFDEFNTSPLQSLIQELAVNRTCTFSSEIRQEIKADKFMLPKNMVFVLICNPLRIKRTDTNIGLIHENAATAFTHRVFPIPDTLLNYAWDFGQLTPEVERKYIEPVLSEDRNQPEYLIDCVCFAQKFLRDNEGENSVSLRDIQRVRVIYAFLFKFLQPLHLANLARDALICTIYLNYFLRIGADNIRTSLDENLVQLSSREKTFPGQWTFKTEFTKIAKMIIEEINRTDSANLDKRQIIANAAVRETVFALVASVLTNTPIMICGKPGSSKTLSTTIVKAYLGLDPNDRTGAVLFKSQPRVVFLLFNGSQITKSTDVKAFYKACQAKAAALNSGLPPNSLPIRVVFLFDEMGLAEIGYDNPLKVLHPLLEEEPGQDPEPGTIRIGFVGISNWKLDLSKMSRALFVARPDPTEDDLKEMVEHDGLGKKLSLGDLRAVPQALAQAYLDFLANESREKEHKSQKNKIEGNPPKSEQDDEADDDEENPQYSVYYHPNFFGLRDFYHLITYLKRNIGIASEFLNSKEQLLAFVENGIQRNFSGKMSVIHKGLTYDLPEGLFLSSKVFLHIFNRRLQLLGNQTGASHSTESYGKSSVITLINQNLIDHGSSVSDTRSQNRIHGSRHLMIFYENPTILKILKDRIKGFYMASNYKASQIIEYSRVNSESELRKIVQELPRILNSKNVLILQDTEQLYSCLYEVLNQYYNQNGDRRCNIHTENGAKSEEVTIHEDLRIIIVMNRADDTINSFETKHPPPFLNRCEKHLVLYSDVINDDQISLKVKLIEELESYRRSKVGQRQILIHGYSDEVIYSLVLGADNFKAMNFRSNFTMLDYLKQLLQQSVASDSKMLKSIATNHSTTDRPEILSKAKEVLTALYSREMYFVLLQKYDLSSKQAETLKRVFVQQHRIGSLTAYINDLYTKMNQVSKERTKHGLVYTLSSPWEAASIIKQSRKKFIKYITYSLYQTSPYDRRMRILEELLSVQDQELSLLIISFENRTEWIGIPELRENVEKLEMGTSKKVLFLAHYSHQDLTNPNKKQETSITFMSDRWNIMAIDNLHESNYDLFAQSLPNKIGSFLDTLADHKTISDSQMIRSLRKRTFLKIQHEFKFPIEKPVQQLLFGLQQDPDQAEAEFFNMLLRKAIKERKEDNRDEEILFDAIYNQRNTMIANGNEHTLEYSMESFQVVVSGRLKEALENSVLSLRSSMIHVTNKLARSFTIGGQSQTKMTQNWIAEAKKLLSSDLMDIREAEEAAPQNRQPQVKLERIDQLKSLESQTHIKRMRKLKEDNNQQLKDRFKNTLNAISALVNKAKPMVKVTYPNQGAKAAAKQDYELNKLQALDLCNFYLQGRKLKVLGASQERLLARMLDAFVDVINPANTTSKLLDLNLLENLCPLAIVLCEVFEPDLSTLPDNMEEELAKQLIDQFIQGLYINASFTIIEKLRIPLPTFSTKNQLESAKKLVDDQKVISAKLAKEERYKPELAVITINETLLDYLESQTDDVLRQFCEKVFPSAEFEGSQYEANLRLAQKGFDFLVDLAKLRKNDAKLHEICDKLLGLIQEFAGLEFKSKQTRSAVLLTVQKCIDVLGRRDDRQAVQAFTDVRAQLEEQPKNWAEVFSAAPIRQPEERQPEEPEPEEEGMIEVGAAPKVVRPEPLSNAAKGAILRSYERLVEKLAESEGRPTAKDNFAGALDELNNLVAAGRGTQTDNEQSFRRAATAFYFVREYLKSSNEDANSPADAAREADIKEIDKVLTEALPNKPAAAILFKQVIQQCQGDEKMLRNKGFTRLAKCLEKFYSNQGFRSFTDLAKQEEIQKLKQRLPGNPEAPDGEFWSNSNSVDIAVTLAQYEILESRDETAVVDMSDIDEGTKSYLYRVLWAFVHRRKSVTEEEKEIYLLISYLAILVSRSDKNKLEANIAKIEQAIHDVLDEQDRKNQETTQNHLKLLIRILNLVKMCQKKQTWLLDSPKEIEANSQEIKAEVEQLRFKSRLQNFHLRANISKFFAKYIAADRPGQTDSLQLVNEIDLELQKILAGGYNQSAGQQQTQAQAAVQVPEGHILDPVTANVLVALEVAPQENLDNAQSVEVYGRSWVPTVHELEVFVADINNRDSESKIQAGFIAKLNALSPVLAQYPGLLQAAQNLSKAFKRYENGCFSGDESCNLRVSDFVGSEIPQQEDSDSKSNKLNPINAEGPRYQSEISKAWVDFRARWLEFKELQRTFAELFDYKRLESSGAKPSLFADREQQDAFLNALLSPNSPVTMFLIPDADYAKNFEPSGYRRPGGSRNVHVTVQQRHMFLMRAVVSELISLHNWFVRALIDAKFTPNLGPRPEEAQSSLQFVEFMSFRPEMIPMLKERQFQTLLEECTTKDKDGKIIIKVNRHLDNLYSKNFRLIKPLGFSESSIFNFTDMQRQNLMDDFKRKLTAKAASNFDDSQNEELSMDAQLQNFRFTSEIMRNNEWNLAEIRRVNLILGSLYDDFELDGSHTHETPLQDIFGQISESIFGFPTLQRKHLIHYLMILGMKFYDLAILSEATDQSSVIFNLPKLRKVKLSSVSDSYKEYLKSQSKLTKTHVEMEWCFWRYYLGIYNKKTLDSKPTLYSTVFLTHMSLYSYSSKLSPDKEPVVMEFVKWHLEHKENVRNPTFDSEKPMVAIPKVMTILEELLAYLQEEERRKEEEETIRREGDEARRRQAVESRVLNGGNEALDATVQEPSIKEVIEQEMDMS